MCCVEHIYLSRFLQPNTIEPGGGSGGGNEGYKRGESEETYHENYSRLQRENTYLDVQKLP